MNFNLDALGPYALVIVAGLFAHACFQLSASMLTLLGSHAIGAGKRHSTVLKLSLSYGLGAFVATLGLLASLTYFFTSVVPVNQTSIAWIIVCALVVLVGWIVLLTYYRRGKGTQLWLPRSFIEFASSRAKKTKNVFESFSLGLTMVIAELPFLIAPLAVAASVLSGEPNLERTIGIFAYAVAACLPLLVITLLIGGGHKISTIQRWREQNKQFLQWTSGLTLILIGVYLFAINIWGKS